MALAIFSIIMLNKEEHLRKNKKYTIGTVLKISENSSRYNHGYHIKYNYNVRGKIYEKEVNYGEGLCKKMIGRSFPVIYDPNEPKNSVMIIFKVTAKLYEVPYPDSLKWVYDCKD